MTEKMRILEDELHENRVEAMRSNQHWMTLKLLFKDNQEREKIEQVSKNFNDIGVQVEMEKAINYPVKVRSPEERSAPEPAPRKELQRGQTFDATETESNNKCLESQLKQAMNLASTRSALLLETENRLAEAQGRVKAMERCLEERERMIKDERAKKDGLDLDKRDENVFSVRIAITLQSK